MSQNESVVAAIQNSSVGAGGTRNISGTTKEVVELEHNYSSFLAAILPFLPLIVR